MLAYVYVDNIIYVQLYRSSVVGIVGDGRQMKKCTISNACLLAYIDMRILTRILYFLL